MDRCQPFHFVWLPPLASIFPVLKKILGSLAFGVKSSAKENNRAAVGLIYSIENSKTENKCGVKKEKGNSSLSASITYKTLMLAPTLRQLNLIERELET